MSATASATALLAAVLLAQSAPDAITVEAGSDHIDVAYAELSENRADAAIARIRANRDLDANDPAALINLGSACARMGRMAKARDAYHAAIASSSRYDLELADGRWMDPRAAARLAVRQLHSGSVLALK